MKNKILPTTSTARVQLKRKRLILRFTFGMLFLFYALSISSQKNTINSNTSADWKDLTGIWYTEVPVPYLVEYTTEHPNGKSVSHKDIVLLERSATIQWDLTQRPDGLIIGTNHWIAYDQTGEKIYEGNEPLLGVYDGSRRAVLNEPVDKSSNTTQVTFEVTFKTQNKINVIGYGVGGHKILAIRFELVRKP